MNNDKQIQISFKDIKEDIFTQVVEIIDRELGISICDINNFDLCDGYNRNSAIAKTEKLGHKQFSPVHDFFLRVEYLREKINDKYVIVNADNIIHETKRVYLGDETTKKMP